MRVIGFLILLVASPVFASESSALLRFAYASSLLADTSFGATTVVSKSSTAEVHRDRRPETRLLQFVSAEQLLPLQRDTPHTSRPVPAAAAGNPPATQPTVAPSKPGSTGAEAEVARSSRPREQLVAALPQPMHVLPPEASDRSPAKEPGAATAEPSTQASAASPSQSRTAHPYKFPAHVTQDLAKTSFVPPWAAQMFETIWQRHAFSYQ